MGLDSFHKNASIKNDKNISFPMMKLRPKRMQRINKLSHQNNLFKMKCIVTHKKQPQQKSNNTENITDVNENVPKYFYWTKTSIISRIAKWLPMNSFVSLLKSGKLFSNISTDESLWKKRLEIEFGIRMKWNNFSYKFTYELFYKAYQIKRHPEFFPPITNSKISLLVWYLCDPNPPCCALQKLSLTQTKAIWGFTQKDLDTFYENSGDLLTNFRFSWRKLHHAFMVKHGSIIEMQRVILKRCRRNMKALEINFIACRNSSNQSRNLIKPSCSLFSNGFLDLNLGIHPETFEYFRNHSRFLLEFDIWMRTYCTGFYTWNSRYPRYFSADYGEVVKLVYYMNDQFAANSALIVTWENLLSRAKRCLRRINNIWTWQCELGPYYLNSFRSTTIIRKHHAYRSYILTGDIRYFNELKSYFEQFANAKLQYYARLQNHLSQRMKNHHHHHHHRLNMYHQGSDPQHKTVTFLSRSNECSLSEDMTIATSKYHIRRNKQRNSSNLIPPCIHEDISESADYISKSNNKSLAISACDYSNTIY